MWFNQKALENFLLKEDKFGIFLNTKFHQLLFLETNTIFDFLVVTFSVVIIFVVLKPRKVNIDKERERARAQD